MKTLLLVLVVLVVVYLDSGCTLICRECNETVCDLNGNCAEGETECFMLWNKSDTSEFYVVQGCAETCPIPEPDQEVKCCSTDYCNSYFYNFPLVIDSLSSNMNHP